MKAAIVAALCVSFAIGSVARADLKPGTYAPDIEATQWLNTDGQPISLAECRGMVVVLFFWVSWHEGGEYIMPLMTLVNASRYGQSAGVFLIGLTDAERKRVDEMLKKEKVFFPIGLEAKQAMEDYDISGYPRVVIIDPNGKVFWSGFPIEEGDKGAPKLIEEIGKAVEAAPPTRTHPELAAKAQAYLKQARQALRADKYREAYTAARKAFDDALDGDPLKTRCQDMLDLLEALGRDKFAEAERAVDEKKSEDAVTLLLEIRRGFRGLDVALAARRQLDALKKKYTEIAQILKQQEDVGQAETMLASAMEQIRARKFGPATTKLEDIVSEYSSTDTAAKAQTLLDRMKKNPDIMAYVRDYKASRECDRLLAQARTYEQTGQPSKARALYREIIDKYSDTKYADEAARRLAQLP